MHNAPARDFLSKKVPLLGQDSESRIFHVPDQPTPYYTDVRVGSALAVEGFTHGSDAVDCRAPEIAEKCKRCSLSIHHITSITVEDHGRFGGCACVFALLVESKDNHPK